MSATPSLIISYDGTPNDEDALALGKMLAPAGFRLALAYVRHFHEFDAAAIPTGTVPPSRMC
jgi:hypothetical protein